MARLGNSLVWFALVWLFSLLEKNGGENTSG